jgi:hypothetical protein
VARPIKEIVMSRWIGGTKKHGRLMVVVQFCENHLRSCGRMFLAFTYKLCKKQGGICYTIKCVTMDDGLIERALEGNPGR